MIDFLKKNWQYLVIVALASVLLYNYLRPTPTGQPMSKKQEKQVQAQIKEKAASAQNYEAAADRANAASDASYAQGKAAAERAQQNRIITHRKPHAPATPFIPSDTAAARLQRLMSNY